MNHEENPEAGILSDIEALNAKVDIEMPEAVDAATPALVNLDVASWGIVPVEQKEGTLTPSAIAKMCDSPKHYHAAYILKEQEETQAMIDGKIYHEYFLERRKFDEKYCLPPGPEILAGALVTNDDLKEECRRLDLKVGGNKAELEARILEVNPDAKILTNIMQAHTQGREMVKETLLKHMRRSEAEIKIHPYANDLIFGEGETEMPGWYKCPRTGVVIRFRLDKLYKMKSKWVILDLKRTDKIGKKKFETFIYDSHLHVLAAQYVDAFKAITGEDALFCWVAVQPKTPYIVKTYVADFGCLEAGRTQGYHAIEQWKECREKNHWPSDDDGLINATLPHWAWRDLEDEGEDENTAV